MAKWNKPDRETQILYGKFIQNLKIKVDFTETEWNGEGQDSGREKGQVQTKGYNLSIICRTIYKESDYC